MRSNISITNLFPLPSRSLRKVTARVSALRTCPLSTLVLRSKCRSWPVDELVQSNRSSLKFLDVFTIKQEDLTTLSRGVTLNQVSRLIARGYLAVLQELYLPSMVSIGTSHAKIFSEALRSPIGRKIKRLQTGLQSGRNRNNWETTVKVMLGLHLQNLPRDAILPNLTTLILGENSIDWDALARLLLQEGSFPKLEEMAVETHPPESARNDDKSWDLASMWPTSCNLHDDMELSSLWLQVLRLRKLSLFHGTIRLPSDVGPLFPDTEISKMKLCQMKDMFTAMSIPLDVGNTWPIDSLDLKDLPLDDEACLELAAAIRSNCLKSVVKMAFEIDQGCSVETFRAMGKVFSHEFLPLLIDLSMGLDHRGDTRLPYLLDCWKAFFNAIPIYGLCKIRYFTLRRGSAVGARATSFFGVDAIFQALSSVDQPSLVMRNVRTLSLQVVTVKELIALSQVFKTGVLPYLATLEFFGKQGDITIFVQNHEEYCCLYYSFVNRITNRSQRR